MIGLYLDRSRVILARDGVVIDDSLESLSGVNEFCHAAVPICVDIPTVTDFLSRLQQIGFNVQAFHDAAALATAALALKNTTLWLELGADASAVARVVVNDSAVRRQSMSTRLRAGRNALRRAWIDLIAESMVLTHRFDPLHDRNSEKQLNDMLWEVASIAASDGAVEVTLPTSRGKCSVMLTRDQFAVRAASIYRELSAMVRELRPAASRIDLLVMHDDLRLPGFIDMLAEFRGCRLLSVRPDNLAAAASRQSPRSAENGEVLLLRGYPIAKATIAAQEVAIDTPAHARLRPTHIVFDANVTALPTGSTIRVGREVDGAGVRLPEGLAGVSRWHCSIRIDSAMAELIDHSAFGTWLNEERVAGRAELFAGDRIRIGDPGIELTLLAIEAADGASAG